MRRKVLQALLSLFHTTDAFWPLLRIVTAQMAGLAANCYGIKLVNKRYELQIYYLTIKLLYGGA